MKRLFIIAVMVCICAAMSAQQWDVKYYHGSKRGVVSHYECVYRDSIGSVIDFESNESIIRFSMAESGIDYKTSEYGSIFLFVKFDLYDAEKKFVRSVTTRGYKDYTYNNRFVADNGEVVKWLLEGGSVKVSIPYKERTYVLRVEGITQSQKNNACANAIV